ncbi:hypothetical protein GW17_00046731 [Ensete ventricosum]|nr:hypothetical protein GW17_00046731 [Ensete ventricosum]
MVHTPSQPMLLHVGSIQATSPNPDGGPIIIPIILPPPRRRLPRDFTKMWGRVLRVRSCNKGVIYMPIWGYATTTIGRSSVSVVIRRLSGFAREAFRGAEGLFGNTRDREPLGRG